MDGTILIADDDRTIRTVLTQAFSRAGCRVHATASLTTLMRWIDEGRGDLVISDVIMPDGNGLETLPKITELRPDLPVIIISAQNTIMTAIQATEAAAYDYMPKPFDLPDLMKRSARALEQRRKHRQRSGPAASREQLPLVGRTPLMQELYRLIARILNTDLPVLILGESGTGKSLIAEVIHSHSDRRSQPFIVAGAADFEGADRVHDILSSARGGTLLFDEIGDIDAAVQSRLVRGLDSFGEHAPRVLASAQQDLADAVESGGFRSDLYYRISAVTLEVPALRARIDDIPVLAQHFLSHPDREMGVGKRLGEDAIGQMRKYVWPGNVRQLENIMLRLAATCPQEVIHASDVLAALGPAAAITAARARPVHENLSESIGQHLERYFALHGDVLPPAGLYGRILREMERPLLEISLSATGGNQAKCAQLLAINRNTLRKKITELDIQVTRRRKLM